jgi:hypothetical protein
MKSRRVKKLDSERPLYENAARIVRMRLKELRSFAPEALEPGSTAAQHDMRIAAKRLRYVLEVIGFCLGPAAALARRRARDLQDVLGELRDSEVMLPRVERRLIDLRRAEAEAVRRRAGSAADLDPRLAGADQHGSSRKGLEALAVHLEARRALLFDRFLEVWCEQERQGIWDRLAEAATGQLERAKERRRAARRADRAREKLERAEQAEREAAGRARRAAEEFAAARRAQGSDHSRGDTSGS